MSEKSEKVLRWKREQEAKGWKMFTPYLPPELLQEIKEYTYRWKLKHPELWIRPPYKTAKQ